MRSTHSRLVGLALLTILLSVFGRTQASVATTVVINEVLYNPSGVDTGFEWVELYNPTCESVDLTNYELTSASGSFYIIPTFTLNPRSFVVVHWRLDGANTSTDLYTGSVGFTSNMGNTTGYVGLFSGTTHTQETIVDYVEYGAGGQSWEATAVGASIWQSGSFVGSAPEGSSIGLLFDGQDLNNPTDWSIYPITTAGVGNDSLPEGACITPTTTMVPSPTLTPTATPSPSPTLQPTPSATVTPSPTMTPSPTPTEVPTPSVTPIPTSTPSPSPIPSITLFPTITPLPSLTLTPTPTVVPSPTITQNPTPVISPIPTPTVTLVPTPVPTTTVKGVVPTLVELGLGFDVPVMIESGSPNGVYYLKFEASIDGGQWYEGKTLSADGASYLAWNSSWSKYPQLQTNATGLGSVMVKAMLKSDSVAGHFMSRIKVSRVSDGRVFYSPIYDIVGTTPRVATPTPTSTPGVSAAPTPTVNNIRILSTIKEARSLEAGVKIELRGIVVAPFGLLGKDIAYIGDATGGIKVQVDGAETSGFKVGDEVKLVGLISSAYGELYLRLENQVASEIVGSKRSLSVNKYRSGMIGESNEGQLVIVSGRVTKTSGSVFYLDDGTGNMKVYIKDTTEIDKPYMRVGYYVQVRGVVSQYNDEYRVLPRYQSDLVVSKTPITKGLVLGTLDEVAALPATGSSVILGCGFILIIGIVLWGGSILMARGSTVLRRQ